MVANENWTIRKDSCYVFSGSSEDTAVPERYNFKCLN